LPDLHPRRERDSTSRLDHGHPGGGGGGDALAIGTLMNARGLMELIILNIGLERGIIEPTLFTIMVLMAIVTTLMATPLFERVYGRERAAAAGSVAAADVA
jgi:Kef-type K+ transport system membrane component KefB